MTEPETPRREIPLWAPFVALLAALVIVSIVAAAAYGVLSAGDPAVKDTDDLPDAASQALTFFQDLVLIFSAFVTVRLAALGPVREQLGLVRVRSWGTALKWAVIAYATFWVAALILAQLFGQPDDQSLVTDLKAEDSTVVLAGWAVLICVVAPVAEELFFRGFMFTIFERRLGIFWAVLLDGVVFGLGHAPADPIQLIALGALGVGLCVLYWRAQSIIPGMGLHALNNAITFGVTKELEGGLFAALVVLSVGIVLGGASLAAAPTKAVV